MSLFGDDEIKSASASARTAGPLGPLGGGPPKAKSAAAGGSLFGTGPLGASAAPAAAAPAPAAPAAAAAPPSLFAGTTKPAEPVAAAAAAASGTEKSFGADPATPSSSGAQAQGFFGGAAAKLSPSSWKPGGGGGSAAPIVDEPLPSAVRVVLPAFEPDAPCGAVTVSDPQKEGSLQKYVTYLIAGSCASDRFSSRKRYSDFEWLRTALSIHFPGILIPSLPKKQMMGKFEAPFIEARRSGIEEFLRRILQRQGVVLQSPLIRRFLTTADAGMDALRKEFDTRSVTEMCREYKACLARDIAACSSEEAVDESQFTDLKEFLERNITAQRETANALADLAAAQRAATSASAAVQARLSAVQDTDSGAPKAADIPNDGARGAFIEAFKQHSAICCESPSAHTDVLFATAERELDDAEAMKDALASIDALQKKQVEIKKRVESSNAAVNKFVAQNQAQAGADAQESPPPTAPEGAGAQAPARKRDAFMSRLSGLGSQVSDLTKGAGAKIAGRGSTSTLEDPQKQLERDTEDATNIGEWITISRATCASNEIRFYFSLKASAQNWCRDQFAGKSKDTNSRLTDVWGKAGKGSGSSFRDSGDW